MTSASVAAPTGAAARVVRTVAGRRALQVVLLLGGLLVLGFLFGERAQAADGPVGGGSALEQVRVEAGPVSGPDAGPSSEPDAGPASEPDSEPDAGPGSEPVPEPVARTVRHVAEPVAESAVEPVTEPVVRPVGEVVHRVTGALREAPDPSELLPAQPLPGSGDGSGSGAEPAPAPDGAPDRGDRPSVVHEGKHRSGHSTAPRADVSYGTGSWRPGSGADRRGDVRHGAVVGEYGTGHGPLPVPVDPSGAFGSATVGDGGAARHGDLHAAALDGRAPVRLLAGPGLSPESAPTRDRHRDIPEFPG
ncbi:hypothetical protein ACFWZ2_10510 [Streptomyces sp. NPDC059002]|uniref:hypothetical protein n=1 Tax=Streptomyces sp. NPDC059002 TaxID=3346690 RepID=UPI0036B2A469